MKVWRYYTRLRPPMPGAIPRQGLVRCWAFDWRQVFDGVGCWGYAEYDRPLTPQEVVWYELEESKNNPLEYR